MLLFLYNWDFSWSSYWYLHLQLLHIYDLTTLKVSKKDKWWFVFLRFNFVTAFHFHHKAAKLDNAGLIFQHLIYNRFTGMQEQLDVICDPLDQKETRSLVTNTGGWKRFKLEWREIWPIEELWNELYDIKNLHLSSLSSGVHHLISWSEVEYCTFHKGSKILHSVRWYQYCGMAKQPEEGGIWDGGRPGASFGTGTWFRHEGQVEDLLLPDGITSTGSTQEEVILALRHYNIGTLHGSQLSCIGGMSRGWGLEKGRKNPNIRHNFDIFSHPDTYTSTTSYNDPISTKYLS